ncbi:hypothetical protein CEXT_107281 [Caerostris extrusa]|uniref:Uncharacterized protein n=1 Tax=Caerostris extrusa TaxID=172846 RepID=A0AAV4T879_CAEEX|nr:hypothetical protein CEXT_107281 [Caerostris extrusa]
MRRKPFIVLKKACFLIIGPLINEVNELLGGVFDVINFVIMEKISFVVLLRLIPLSRAIGAKIHETERVKLLPVFAVDKIVVFPHSFPKNAEITSEVK